VGENSSAKEERNQPTLQQRKIGVKESAYVLAETGRGEMCSKFNFLFGWKGNQAARLRSIPNWKASLLMNWLCGPRAAH
jgi:hypothetical protein